MRVIGGLLIVLLIGFVGVLGFYWMRDGSLESAGREMDSNLSKIDSTTEPLQDSVKGVGDGVKETIENATDGDDKT
jgi:hypothetical protein